MELQIEMRLQLQEINLQTCVCHHKHKLFKFIAFSLLNAMEIMWQQ